MRDTVHRYAPSEPFPRVVIALLATTVGVPLFLWGAVGLWSGILRPVVFLLLLGGGVLGAVGYILARGVADQAAAASLDANPVVTSAEHDEEDPVSVLQRRYARGELAEDEFDRRVERLLESDRSHDPPAEERLTEDAVE